MRTVKFLYVYILKCSDGTYYTGITNNPGRRLMQHNMGIKKESYTFTRRPLEMVYCELFTDFNLAIEWETRIKKWGKVKKEALINENWEKLKEMSVCKNVTSHLNEMRRLVEKSKDFTNL
ncbi:MAG TPA: GIY-YIG nuclease family protein [Bacteroidia bacterium]